MSASTAKLDDLYQKPAPSRLYPLRLINYQRLGRS
jgi:hypothetical protein